jgi:hypothetical protein
LPAKEDFFSGLGFVYLSFACGSALSAIEEFMVPKQIETFLRRIRGGWIWKRVIRHADHSD